MRGREATDDSMTLQPQEEINEVALVLLGNMNPALHHPIWYHHIGAIDQRELDQALSAEFIFMPQVAQFKTDKFQVVCDQHRWQASATHLADAARLIDLIEAAFDKKLTETPIRAYGLNYHFHAKTNCPNVAGALAGMLARAPLGFEPSEGASGTLSFTRPFDGGQLRCSVEGSSRGVEMVYVGINVHYEAPPNPTQNSLETFLLKPLLARRMETVRPAVDRIVASIVAGLNSEAKL
jgi:hypothetical protein